MKWNFVLNNLIILPFCVWILIPGITEGMKFNRYPEFSNITKEKYNALKGDNEQKLVEQFCKCSIQGSVDALDPRIRSALNNIAENEVGKETLLTVTAKLYSFVECARTLEELVNKIPVIPVTGNEKIEKVKKVVLLLDALGVHDAEVVFCFSNLNTWLNQLKQNPIVFPNALEPYKHGSLFRIFKNDFQLVNKKAKQQFIIDQINYCWNINVKTVVDNFLPLLRFGMFSLEVGPTMYEYDSGTHHYVVKFSDRKITARCMTGPLLCDNIDSIKIPPMCCLMDDQEISAASGLHHEIFHHLVIGIEGNGFNSFSRLAVVFLRENIDSSYVRYLKDIYTDADEFRAITGLFVDDKNELYFDPCSEGAYLHKEGKSLRGTHRSDFRAVHVPISFIHLLEKSYGKLNLDYREKLDHGRIEWYN